MAEPVGTRSPRRHLLSHLLAVSLIGAALLSVGAVSGLAADKTIQATGSLGSYDWTPSSVDVSAGGTVELKNMNGTHAVTWEAGNPETPSCPGVPSTGAANWSGTCTFAQSGEFKFHCTVHPVEMKGTVTVSGPATPVATTGTASAITDTGATLNGTVNPNGQATAYYFEYGTSTAYGTKTTEESVGEGTTNVSKSVPVSALTASTTYHFRIVAKYGGSTTKAGADKTFTTTGPPSATTGSATGIGGSTATLNGTVNPNGHETKFFFKYGTTTAYGQTAPAVPQVVGSGTTPSPATASISGLAPRTTYHFKLVAESSAGTKEGSDQSFTTFGSPLATTGQAASITDVAATLQGSVNAQGQDTKYFFEWGTTSAYGQVTAETAVGKGTTGVAVSTAISGLAPATTYHFQVVAKNASGTTKGGEGTFTTAATPPPPQPPVTPGPTPTPPAPPAAGPPDTKITLKPPAKTKDSTPTLKFKATVAGASYQCSVDRKPFKACRSPFTAPALKPGRHTIKVRAVAAGQTDPTPAACSVKILAKKKKK